MDAVEAVAEDVGPVGKEVVCGLDEAVHCSRQQNRGDMGGG